jgi:EpsI family protein
VTGPHRALLVAVLVMLAAVPVSWMVGDPLDRLLGTTPLARPLADAIPTEIGGWRTVQDEEMRDFELEITKVDDYVSRLYRGPQGESVFLYVAYHGNKERGMQTFYHNAKVCYPAAGWQLANEQFQDLTLHDAAKHVPTCRYTFQRGGERLSVLTFFQVDDELLDQSPRNKPFWLLADRLTPRGDEGPGTFVQVQVVVHVGDDPVAAATAQERFLQAFGARIFQAIP